MKLLVTGGSGFLGRRAAAHLRSLGHEVLTPTHSQLDITDPSAVRAWFRAQQPEAVIHTAAISDTGLCQREPVWSEAINVNGCLHLAEACRETGSKLVFCSTDQVYFGSPVPGPHREEDPLAPPNVYGSQKLRAERQSLEIAPDTVCLRLSWMYSPQRLSGDHGNFLTTLLDALKDTSKPLTWPIHDRRGITPVDAVVRQLPAALTLPGGPWNFGGENRDDTYHLVRGLLEELGMDQALARLTPNEAAFAQAPRDMTLDLTKARSAGIDFPSTRAGLLQVLKEMKEETA